MSNRANSRAGTGPAMDLVSRPAGPAGITWYPAHGPARAVVLLGHGTATGVEAPDLQAIAAALPEHGVSVALAYPLLGPGSTAELLATGRPRLIIQGTRDPFGRPRQFPALPPGIELTEIPAANHTFGTPDGIPRSATMRLITDVTSQWIERQLAQTLHAPPR